jgi:hypothetical protein
MGVIVHIGVLDCSTIVPAPEEFRQVLAVIRVRVAILDIEINKHLVLVEFNALGIGIPIVAHSVKVDALAVGIVLVGLLLTEHLLDGAFSQLQEVTLACVVDVTLGYLSIDDVIDVHSCVCF